MHSRKDIAHIIFFKFHYGRDLLRDWALSDCPSFMQRMHNWFKRACRLGLKTIYAPHHPDVFGPKGPGIFDIMFDFASIQHMFRLQQLGIEMVRLQCMYELMILIYFILRYKELCYMHKYVIVIHYYLQDANI